MWNIEEIRSPASGFKFAIFDFDGTLSLLRQGWQEVMVPYFVEVVVAVAPEEDPATIATEVREFVDILTGKQTIYQCIRLAQAVEKRGGTPLDPYEYKAEYLRRLMEKIQGRIDALRNGEDLPAMHLVPGSEEFLKLLRERGISLYLASGTDEDSVVDEAGLLGLADYFDGGIHGAKDSTMDCAKEVVIRQILSENGIDPSQLLVFGDGYVEIQLVKEIGGYAVAVATDEERREGIDPWKRERLLSAKADAVIPDFKEAEKLIAFLGV